MPLEVFVLRHEQVRDLEAKCFGGDIWLDILQRIPIAQFRVIVFYFEFLSVYKLKSEHTAAVPRACLSTYVIAQ